VRDGEELSRVPPVTTILSKVVNKSDVLTWWAAGQATEFMRGAFLPDIGYSETYIEAVLGEARKAHAYKKREAADIGTQAHHLLEHYLRSGDGVQGDAVEDGLLISPDLDERVVSCYSAGRNWLAANSYETLHLEKLVYSRKFNYAGRLDKLATVGGVLSLVDWKSSKGIYPEYLLQTAAYVQAYEEEFPDQRVEKRYLIKLGKDDGEFEAHEFDRTTLDADIRAFNAAITLYQRLKELDGVSRKPL
jgi:hypothetical protein